MHLVKVGTVQVKIPPLLELFNKFKNTAEYQQIVDSNDTKTADEKRLKKARDTKKWQWLSAVKRNLIFEQKRQLRGVKMAQI